MNFPSGTLASPPIVQAQYAWYLPLIPFFPLLGAVLNGFFGSHIQRFLGTKVNHGIAIFVMLLACGFSWLGFIELYGMAPENRALYNVQWNWLTVGLVDARFAFWLDPLSSLMTLIITTIGTLIHIYSVGYMHGDQSYWRFFAYLNLFVTMMLILVLGDNFLLMFVGWEGVGLASYLLIGFWYKELANAAAGMKAFVVNRFGDACFVIGLFLLFWGLQGNWSSSSPRDYAWGQSARAAEHQIGPRPKLKPNTMQVTTEKPHATLTFSRLRNIFEDEIARQEILLKRQSARVALSSSEALKTFDQETQRMLVDLETQLGWRDARGQVLQTSFVDKRLWGMPLIFLVLVLFFLGATAKSAQIPFYVWLPDAMAGPTPVSALIHAATMVTAGVYMIARLNFLFALSPGACSVVAFVGALTALFAASMGLFQYDIKKVLAYSTVSQLGFMFMGVGVGAYWVGVFHLLTHACFKACLFLGSGSVILGCHHEQDMRRMGGLAKYMPATRMTYAFACLAIAGFPLFAGFCSKDEILWKAFTSSGIVPYFNYLVWGMGVIAATFTAFYMYRSYYMTFSGTYRGNETPLPDPYPTATDRARELLLPKPVRGPTPEMLEGLKAHGHGQDHGHAHEHDHEHEHHGGEPHESPWTMTVPLWVLGSASLVIGVVLFLPPVFGHLIHVEWHPLESWLAPVLAPGQRMMTLYAQHTPQHLPFDITNAGTKYVAEVTLAGISVVVALLGWYAARWLYKDGANPLPERWMAIPTGPIRALHRLVYNKYFIDEIYYTVMIRGMSRVWNGLKNVDVYLVDGLVNAAGFLGKSMGYFQGAIDKYIVDGAVLLVARIIAALGQRVRALQTGQTRTYLIGALGGAVFAFLLVVALA